MLVMLTLRRIAMTGCDMLQGATNAPGSNLAGETQLNHRNGRLARHAQACLKDAKSLILREKTLARRRAMHLEK